MQELNKSFKERQENTIKSLREIIQTVQDLIIKIETMKKTQNEGMLESEKLRKQSGTTDASITNRI